MHYLTERKKNCHLWCVW